jgi:filamin
VIPRITSVLLWDDVSDLLQRVFEGGRFMFLQKPSETINIFQTLLKNYIQILSGISFVPMEPGEHLVRVKKSGEDVPGSPFTVMVEAAEAVNAVGRPCDCHLDIPGLNLPSDLTKIKSTLKRPDSDTEEPIKLKVLSDNTLSASFVPRSPGEHLISVKKFNRHLSGSPFRYEIR